MATDLGATKARVITAASALFAERGFHGTTARDIAQRARVNLAAGHYHFGSKETLYLEVLRAQFADIAADLAQRGAQIPTAGSRTSPATWRRLLHTRIAAMLEILLGPPPGLHGTLMMREMCDPSAALPHIVEQFIWPHRREMAAIIAGLFPRLAPGQIERCVFSMVGQVFFYRHMLPMLPLMIPGWANDRAWREATAEHIVEFSLGGMRRVAAQPAASKTVRAGRRKR